MNNNVHCQNNGPLKFVRIQQTVQSWLIEENKDSGTMGSNKRYSFALRMARSTCILSFAICCVFFTSSAENWGFSLRNGGMFNVQFLDILDGKSCVCHYPIIWF